MSRKVSMQENSFPKTDVRYWEGKVGFHTAASRTYCVQIQHANRRSRINLKTANKAQAALSGSQTLSGVCANGWEETLRRRRGEPVGKKANVTVGEYVEAAAAKSLAEDACQLRAGAAQDCRRHCRREKALETRCHSAAHTHAREDRSMAD